MRAKEHIPISQNMKNSGSNTTRSDRFQTTKQRHIYITIGRRYCRMKLRNAYHQAICETSHKEKNHIVHKCHPVRAEEGGGEYSFPRVSIVDESLLGLIPCNTEFGDIEEVQKRDGGQNEAVLRRFLFHCQCRMSRAMLNLTG